MKLSILICGLTSRLASFGKLMDELSSQYKGNEVEILSEIDAGEMTIGAKRNLLLSKAKGEYECFIDDDDMVSKDYILKIMTALEHKPDCCSLMGVITWNGEGAEVFEHSILHDEWKTNHDNTPIRYERPPNHLNVIKSSIANQFKFEEINHGEDKKWSEAIHASGLLKREATITGVIYHYQYQRK